MTKQEKIRAACARFRGYKICTRKSDGKELLCLPADCKHGRFIMYWLEYRPDEKIEQADKLKAELRKQEFQYEIMWHPSVKLYSIRINNKFKNVVYLVDRVSEEFALAAAVAELQIGLEKKG